MIFFCSLMFVFILSQEVFTSLPDIWIWIYMLECLEWAQIIFTFVITSAIPNKLAMI